MTWPEQNTEGGTMRYKEQTIEGRNAVLEAFRSGKTIDKLYILDGCQDGSISNIKREARRQDTIINFVTKERLDQLSSTGHHQGVIAQAAAYSYATVEEMLETAREKGEDPFLILLDNIEDPHNLGAIIRTANLAGAHGVIIPKRRAAGLTAVVARASAGALNYTPVAKVTNLTAAIKELKARHIARLQNGECTIELGFIFTDILTNCERVSDHCSNVAVYTMQLNSYTLDTHKYLHNIKSSESGEFIDDFNMYSDKYSLSEQ